MRLVVTCATHRGARDLNEDGFLTLVGNAAPCGTLGLLAVADGIGGQGTGAAASDLALRTLADVFSAGCAVAGSTLSELPHLLRFAMQKANAAVFQAQADRENREAPMGTTCVAAAVTADRVHVVSVGDSRAYILRQGELLALTQDEWVKQPDGVTVVTRAVGWQPLLPTDPTSHEAREGDQVILCTDGLTDALSEDEIRRMLVSSESSAACAALAQAAAAQPEADNVTIVIARLVR